jgi:type VI protein secretion system component VasK
MGLLELVKSTLGSQPGITLLLLVCLVWALVAYRREKAKNDKVGDDRLREAREDTELLVETVNEAVNTVREFKASNDALKVAFEALATVVREGRATPGKPVRGG